ncbi:MAG: hypothetical protein DMG44_14425 [Acidobacteria bacterium]|nr:MAG: hypothetical protein DMG44_14425 [Acidobacteriota bacterium]
MSLIQSYHSKDFGIVCSDGRVSVRHPDGHYAARPKETARKFKVLRASPGLVLAGSSSVSKFLDFSVYDAVRRYVEKFPEASFDQVAGIIVPTVHAAALSYAKEVGKSAGKAYRFLVSKFLRARSARPKLFDSTDRVNLNLLGYDRERRRVRNRIFCCTDRSSDEWEHDSGVAIIGDVDSEEGIAAGDKLLELIGRDRTPQAVAKAMLSLAAEISASHPETIGPPYSFHLITKGASGGSSLIEEQFRRSLAISGKLRPAGA